MRRWFVAIAVGTCTGCHAPPRPAVLEEVDRVHAGAGAAEAAVLAPQAFLYAEGLRKAASRASGDGDRAGAEILGEHALAAFARAAVLARLAKADDRVTAASKRAAAEREALGKAEEQQRRVAAEAEDLELRLRVVRDAQPLASSEPASAERERARLAAARALGLQARLLCVSAQMLAADTPAVLAAFTALDALDAELAAPAKRTPIDEAVRLRSLCLAELTRARRGPTSVAPEAGRPDALLEELSRAGHEPSRDDRGVVVTLRGLFRGAALDPRVHERLTALGQVARAHPDFPVLVVSHVARGAAARREVEKTQLVAEALRAAGAGRVEVRPAGSALPLLPAGSGTAAARNERVEVVFVAPAQ